MVSMKDLGIDNYRLQSDFHSQMRFGRASQTFRAGGMKKNWKLKNGVAMKNWIDTRSVVSLWSNFARGLTWPLEYHPAKLSNCGMSYKSRG